MNIDAKPAVGLSRGRVTAILSVLALVILVSFLPCLDNGFVNWDDEVYFLENPQVKSLTWESARSFFLSYDRFQYKPLTFLFFAAEHRLFGVVPFWYHAASLVLHVLNAWLIFWLFFLIRRDAWVAFGVALLFGIHPLRVESVAWVTEQKDLLFTFFVLGAFISYVYFRRISRKFLYYGSLVLFAASLLVKPMAMMFPALLLFWELIYEKRRGRHLVLPMLPFFTLTLVIAGINALGFVLEGQAGSIGASLGSVFFRIYFYISKIFWPAALSCLYPNARYAFFAWEPIVAPALVAAFFMTGFFAIRDKRSFYFGTLFFLLFLFPLLLPTRYYIVADRYVYLAAAGIFLIIVEALKRVWEGWGSAKCGREAVLAVGIMAVVFAMAHETWRQSHVWRDSVSLWEHAARFYPEDAKVRNNLGIAYFRRGDTVAALREAGHYWRLEPTSKSASQMGSVHLSLKEFETARMFFSVAIRLDPGNAGAYNNMGLTYSRNPDAASQREAAAWFKKAIQTAASFDDVMALKDAYQNLAQAYLILDDAASALTASRKAVRLNPDAAASQALLLQALVKTKQYGEALDVAGRLMMLTPRDPWCLRMTAWLVAGVGMVEEARALEQRAKELEEGR